MSYQKKKKIQVRQIWLEAIRSSCPAQVAFPRIQGAPRRTDTCGGIPGGSVTLPGNPGPGSGPFWRRCPLPFPTTLKLGSGSGEAVREGPGARVAGPPGRVAGSRAQDTPRTRAWLPRRPQGPRPRSPYPQDVVALRAAARDLDALRGAHGGGRSVRPGRLSAAPPRAPPAPRLRA